MCKHVSMKQDILAECHPESHITLFIEAETLAILRVGKLT